MSEYDQGQRDRPEQSISSNVTPFRKTNLAVVTKTEKARGGKKEKTKNKNQIITPLVSFPESDPLIKHLDDIRQNNGAAVGIIRHLLPDNTSSIDRITTVERQDGSVGFIEIRVSTKPSGKSYRTLYPANVSGSDNPKDDGYSVRHDFTHLAAYGLLTPTNISNLLAAQEYADARDELKLAIFWCEGEKARQGANRRLSREPAKQWFIKEKYCAVTSATLGGAAGVLKTNYALRPPPGSGDGIIVAGKNDAQLRLRDAIHYIVLDNDKAGREEGSALMERLEKEYFVPLHNIRVVEPPAVSDVGWDDADDLPEGFSEQDRLDQFINATPMESAWTKMKVTGVWPDVDKSNEPKPTMRNTVMALEMMGVTFSQDIFRGREYCNGEVLSNSHCIDLRDKIIGVYSFDPGKDNVYDAAMTLAHRNQYHPVLNYLDSLEWDGVKRIDGWMSEYLGAEETDFNYAISAITLIAAVRRIKSPGCKFDTITIFEGATGKGKSTAMRVLASDEFFSDSGILHLSEKEHMENLQGVWIQEIAELDGISKTDVNTVKTFASRQGDRGRPAYGRVVEVRPRQCIFFGSTNESAYLRDETGNRRFWPVRVSEIDLRALERDRDQLWAEAVLREASGESIVLPERLWKAAAAEQLTRMVDDPWQANIRLIGKDDCSLDPTKQKYRIPVLRVYENIFNVPTKDRSISQSKRIIQLMINDGWSRPIDVMCDGKVQRCFEKNVSAWDGPKESGSSNPDAVPWNYDDIPF